MVWRPEPSGNMELQSYVLHTIIIRVSWVVEIGDEFEPEFDEMPEDVQTEILALSRLLQQLGPQLGRPQVDTLNDSRHANMKGTAVQCDGRPVAGGLRLRYKTEGRATCGGKQVRGQRKAVLPEVDPQGG